MTNTTPQVDREKDHAAAMAYTCYQYIMLIRKTESYVEEIIKSNGDKEGFKAYIQDMGLNDAIEKYSKKEPPKRHTGPLPKSIDEALKALSPEEYVIFMKKINEARDEIDLKREQDTQK